MSIKSFLLALIAIMLLSNSSFSQTNPSPQALPFSIDFSGFNGSTTIYPAGIQGWTISGSTSTTFPTAAPNGDQVLASGTNATTSAGVFDMNGKIGFLNTASGIRSIALSINTSGLNNINVSFVAATQRQQTTERIGAIGLQYRVGTTGTFTNVSSSEYQNPGGSNNNSGTGSLNPQTINVTLPAACNDEPVVQLRWVYREISGSGGRPSFSVDDISITGSTASSPSIVATPASLTGFSYVVGNGPSAEQSFSISGSNLTAAISIAPPANYEISLVTGGSFVATNPITLNHTGGSVAATNIYVRLKAGLTTGDYNGEIINATSTGADGKTVTLSGSVTAPPTPTITINPSQLYGFQYFTGSGPSEVQTASVTGSNLTGNISITAPAAYEISSAETPFSPADPLILPHTGGNVNTTVYLRMKDGLASGIYNQQFTVSSPGATNDDLDVSGAVFPEAFTMWDFNVAFTAASPETTTGTGTASVIGSMTGPGSATGTTTGCSQTTGNAWAIGTANPGTTNETSGVQFMVPTTGRENIWLAYDQRLSNTATRTARIQYTLNGTDWVNLDMTSANYLSQCANRGGIDNGRIDASNPIGSNVSDSWGRRVINFSAITGANNNPNFGVRILAAHYASTGQFRQANSVGTAATAGTWRFDNVTFGGDQIAGAVATKLAVTSINSGNNPTIIVPFSVTVQAQDNSNVATNVSTNTQVTLTKATGTGTLGGTLTETILAGENSVTFTNVTYNAAEAGVSITATATSGMTLTPATSGTFTVLAPASQLGIVGAPANGQVNTNLASFTVEARRPDNSVDGSYTGNITIAKATGPGIISGTLTKAAVNGIATFNDIQLNQAGTYTISASASGLTGATSSNILITDAPMLTEVLLPQYIQGINGSNNDRILYAYRVTLSNLLPNATYRYINQIIDVTDVSATAGGAGNVIYLNSSGIFTRTSSASFTTVGGYGEFSTDAGGSFTGWFINEPTANPRFTPGNNVQMRIRLNNGAGGTAAVTYLTTTNTVKVLNFGTTGGSATQGTALRVESNFDPGNFAILYDNTAGTGRPLYAAPIEITGLDYSATTWAAFFRNNVVGDDGAFAAIIPNQNANGVKLIQQRAQNNGAVVNSFSSNNGQWGSFNTVNPAGGTATVIVVDLKQNPSIAVSPSSLSGFSYTADQGPSSTQVFSVSGSNLLGNVTLEAPAAYEMSLTNAPSFDPTSVIFLSPTGTTLSTTNVYTRLKAGLTAGTYNQQILIGSPSADPRQVAVSGNVAPGISVPENHVTAFTATAISSNQITVSWTDAVPAASSYLIKGSATGFGDIQAPVDGVAETNGTLVRNVNAGVQNFTFEALNSSSTYYFKIFPYNGTGASIKYKSDASVPQASATTPVGPVMIEVVLPQYIQGVNGTNNNRITYAFRVAFNNLTPNATYRYINQAVNGSDAATSAGAGNPIYLMPNGEYVRTTSTSFTTSGQYGEFTTDASGNYAGWFLMEPTGNARFTPGQEVMMRIRLNNGADGTSAAHYFTTQSIQVVNFGTDSNPSSGTALRANSNFAPKNLVFLYGSNNRSMRPIAGSSIEITGIDYSALTSTPSFYRTAVSGINGAWGTIIPNSLPGGITMIEERSFTTGQIVSTRTASNGVWGSTSTVNPTGGLTNVLVLDLDLTPTISLNPATLSGFSYTGQGPSTVQFFTVSGTNLSSAVLIQSPAAYEISLSTGTNFNAQASLTLNPVDGVIAPVAIYVRLKQGLTPGNYQQQITLSSTGAVNKTVSLTGDVMAPATEPAAFPASFTVSVNSMTQLTASWMDAVPAASGYIIKGSTTSFAAIQVPVDGIPESDGLLVKNVAAGTQSAVFSGLQSETTYYFRIFPYNGSGAGINYKTDGAAPQASATTQGEVAINAILLPRFMQGTAGTNNNRLPYAYRARLTNLRPNSTYRYINQAVNDSDGPTSGGAGNPVFVSGNNFVRSSNPSFATAGQYGEFTTDASGSFTGWFVMEPTGNARFTTGAEVQMRIRLNDGMGGTAAAHYLTATGMIQLINFGTANDASSGTAIRATTSASPRNFAFIYDNTGGAGRPLYGTSIETTGLDYATNTSFPAFYRQEVGGVNGAWGGIVPNINNAGVRRYEERSLTTGLIVSQRTSEDGFWGLTNTVNPAGGLASVIVLNLSDGVNTEKLAGQLKYFNPAESAVPSPNNNGVFYVQLFENGIPVRPRQLVRHNLDLNLASYFEFDNVEQGKTYTLRIWEQNQLNKLSDAWTWNNWGGISSIDALIISYMSVNSPLVSIFPWILPNNASSYTSFATELADVNNSLSITGLDALSLMYRLVGEPGSNPFPGNKPNFVLYGEKRNSHQEMLFPQAPDKKFSMTGNYEATASATSVYYELTLPALETGLNIFNIYFTATGDMNASYVPGAATAASGTLLNYLQPIQSRVGDIAEMELLLNESTELASANFSLKFNQKLIEIVELTGTEFYRVDLANGLLHVGLLKPQGLKLNAGQSLVKMKVRILAPITEGQRYLELDRNTEFAAPGAIEIHGLQLYTHPVVTETIISAALTHYIYPNPSSANTSLKLHVPEPGIISLKIYNSMGQLLINDEFTATEGILERIIERNQLPAAGIYTYKVQINGNAKVHQASGKIVIMD